MDITPELKSNFDDLIQNNHIVVFMKGTRDFPMCGYTARINAIFNQLGVEITDVNVLEDAEVFEGIQVYSDWPTFPQVYIGGEFIGGCDITCEMFENGELKELIGA